MTTFIFEGGDYIKPGTFEALPEGKYKVKISKTDLTPNKQQTGDVLKLTFDIIEGEYIGLKFFQNLNVKHIDEKTVKYAHNSLRGLMKAVDLIKITDTSQLLNKELIIDVKIKEYNGKPINNVYDYESLSNDYPNLISQKQQQVNQMVEDEKNFNDFSFEKK
jgi:hypothetical protein